MQVGIITYQTGHLKTLQLALKLLVGSHRVTLFAFPFKLRPHTPPIFQDRPHQLLDLDVAAFCRRHGIGYVPVGGWSDGFADRLGIPGDQGTPEVFLTCIAKIIPAAFIQERLILNAHPGLLPQNRGVDAFKWCVIREWAFGITLHAIDEAIDRGTILHRIRVPVLPDDGLADVARRAYAMEVDLMAAFSTYLPRLVHGWHVGDAHPLSREWVPPEQEARLEDLFLRGRERFVHLSTDYSHQPHEADAFYRHLKENHP